MTIIIKIPDKKVIFSRGIDITLAPRGHSWSELDLGEHRKRKGVYIIHHNRVIKYIGKTNGEKMSFGIRLRRHFQESAAGIHTYPRLAQINTPPCIKVSMFDLDEIQEYVNHKVKNPRLLELIPIFESALIFALKPAFQQ